MGCDIHSYVEIQDNHGDWYSVDVWETEFECFKNDVDDSVEIYAYTNTVQHSRDRRDYMLFGFLSDGVRYSWEDPLPTLEWPEDLSAQVKAAEDYWESDGHSHNWVLLSDLRTRYTELALLKTDEETVHLCRSLKDIIEKIDSLIKSRFCEDNKLIPDEAIRFLYWFDN